MARHPHSPLGAVARGLAAGAIGTAVMTAGQTAYYKITGAEGSMTPAEVAKRIIEGVLHREVTDDQMQTLNNAMHWFYGTSWGTVYGIAAGDRSSPSALKGGLAFGTAVWAASLVHLPVMKLSPPIWEMPPSAIAPDWGFHALYGLGVAAAYRALA